MRLSRRQFIGLIGALGAGTARALSPRDLLKLGWGKDGPLVFATMADLHVLNAKSTAIVNRAVNVINAMDDVRFAVVIGDLATDGRLAELNLAKDCLARLNKPYFVVPGNHDVDPTLTDIYANYARAFDEGEWSRDNHDWAFIGLDSCDGTKSTVAIPETRMAWLEKRLKKISQARPIALFVHHPFNPNTKDFRVTNADGVLGLFANHNLKLVAAGHYHGNQAEERDGVLFTTTACCSSTRGNFDGTEARGFRVFRENNGVLETEFVEVPL